MRPDISFVPDVTTWIESLPDVGWTGEPKRVIACRPDCIVLVASVASSLVGCLACLPDLGGAELHYVGVDPSHQKQGVGTALFRKMVCRLLVQWPEGQPPPEVTAHTPHGATGAGARLLVRLGFRTSDNLSWEKELSASDTDYN